MLACLLSIWFSFFSGGDTPPPDQPAGAFLVIQNIQIEGNKKTKSNIILRELDIAPGDTLPGVKIDEILKRNKNKIFNTNLFNSVELLLQPNEFGGIDLMIQVTERWYIFPMVIFELGDRNFNEWWSERGRDLRRLNYGARIVHRNMFGRGDEMRATVQFGFTRRFDLGYNFRYLDKAQKNGLAFLLSYSDNNNVAYQTENNKLTFLNTSNIMRERYFAMVRFTHRSQFYNFHRLETRLHYNTIADTIARLNPNYFLNGETTQRYAYLSYEFTHDRRDMVAYPLRGHFFSTEIERFGLLPSDDLNKTQLRVNAAIFRQLGKSKKYFWNANFQGMTSYPSRQPYPDYRALGFGFEYLRGYERYLIDGQHFALAKFTFKREIFAAEFVIPGLNRLQQFQTMPVNIYLTAFSDFGYVVDPSNNPGNARLANQWLYSTGVGLDVVTFYNVVMRLNYAYNRQGERGFFFNFVRDI